MIQYLISFLFCLFFCTLLFSQEDMKIRVEYLEKQVRELTEEVLKLRSSLQTQEKTTEKLLQEKNHSPIKLYDELISSFEKENQEKEFYTFYRNLMHFELGGYLETRWEAQESREEENILDLSRLGLQLQSSLNSFLSIEAEIQISRPEKIDIVHAYLLMSVESFLNFKIGILRIPLGRYQRLYAPPLHSFGSTPFFYESFFPSVWSEAGLSILGEWQEGIPFKISYELLFSNGLAKNSFQANHDTKEKKLYKENKQGTARIEISPKTSLDIFHFSLGVSGSLGIYDPKDNKKYKAISLDTFFCIGPFPLIGEYDRIEFSAEYIRYIVERSNEILKEFPETASRIESIYYQIDYFFFPQKWRGISFLFGEESSFGIGFRYEKNKIHANLYKEKQAYTVGFHFRPEKKIVFRLEYSFIEDKHDWYKRFFASFATSF